MALTSTDPKTDKASANRAPLARTETSEGMHASEWLILGFAFGLGAFFAWYVYSLDLIGILVDQNAHLNIARQIFDSLTPGITQLGYWPPLLHIAMAPFAAIRPLFDTGLAGAFTLIPFLALGAFFLFRLIFHFSGSRLASAAGALLFAANPYMLYYAVTPMMEVLFVTLILGTAYVFANWLDSGKIGYLVLTGVFVALAGLARFEGLVLLPMVGAIIGVKLWLEKRTRAEIEAVLLLFAFLAVLGAASIIAYSWFFGDDPAAFLKSPWSAYNQQRDYTRPTEHNLIGSAQYLIHAAYYMIGKTQLLAAAAATLFLFLAFPRFNLAAVSAILLSPFIFDLFALWQGYIILYVKEFPPFYFFNERYGLYGIGFAIAIPFIFLGFALRARGGRAVSYASKLFAGTVSAALIAAGFLMAYRVAFVEGFKVVRESAERYPAWSQLEIARALRDNYDFGKIFITRAVHDFVTARSGIPFASFVVESNYPYYDQLMGEPWLFARWVVMYNSSDDANILLPNWNKQNERISQAWGRSPIFEQYYSLAYENPYERLYRINEPAVRRYARLRNFDSRLIPSLNPEIEDWDPDTVYADMARGRSFALLDSGFQTADASVESGRALPPVAGADDALVPAAKAISENFVLAAATTSEPVRHAVRKGETLWSIAEDYWQSGAKWLSLARENSIQNPHRIYPGQVLIIPRES